MNPLARVFQFVFGCRHRHLSRVFTIKERTYKVCFDCGEEFDLPVAHLAKRPTIADNARSRA
jgi:RNA polymerase-binding transcription factor DksA